MASNKDQRKGRRSVDFRQRRQDFDRAWQGTRTPEIDRFLPPTEVAESYGYTRRQLLAELVEIDLECRWQAGFPRSHYDSTDDPLPSKPKVEDYLAQFPELGSTDDLPVELVIQEYKARHKTGESVDHDEYRTRFPALAERLSVELRNAETNMTEPTARFVRCPQCDNSIAVPALAALARKVVTCGCGEKIPIVDDRTGDQREGELVASYRLLRWLGRGSFANVWQAFDEHLERNVALKIPYVRHQGEEGPNLTVNEARAVAGLKHPNIVQVFELGKGEEQFIASEFIAGQNLEHALRIRPRSPVEIAQLCRKMADALHYMHTKGVVHRDVKPSNILLDEHDEPHLTDFGLAKREDEHIALSSAGELIGTVAYMSPEQAAGKGNTVDGRADLFSLGVVMYEMLAGTLPFHGDRLTIMNKIEKDDPPSIVKHAPKVPRDLETLCFRCLEKEPAKRFATAAEFSDELGRFLRGEPILTDPPSLLERLVKYARRYPARAIAAGMSTVASVAIIAAIGLAVQRAWERRGEINSLERDAFAWRDKVNQGIRTSSTTNEVDTTRGHLKQLGSVFTKIRELEPEWTGTADDAGGAPIDDPDLYLENAKQELDRLESTIRTLEDHVDERSSIKTAAIAAKEHYQSVMALIGSALFTGLPLSDEARSDAAQRTLSRSRVARLKSPVDSDALTNQIAKQSNRIAAYVANVPDSDPGERSSELKGDEQFDAVEKLPSAGPKPVTFPSNDDDSLRAMQDSARAALKELGIRELQADTLTAESELLLWNRMRKSDANTARIAADDSARFADEIEPLQRQAGELILLHAYATFRLGEPNALAEIECAARLGLSTTLAASRNHQSGSTSSAPVYHIAHTYRQMVAEFTAARNGLPPVETELPVDASASWFDHFFAGCRCMPRVAADDQRGKYLAALRHFKASHQKQSDSPWVGYFMAVCYIPLGHAQHAEDKLTDHEGEVASFPFTHILRGIARGEIFRSNATGEGAALSKAQSDFGEALHTIDQAEREGRMEPAVAQRLHFAIYTSRGKLHFDASRRMPEALHKAIADYTAARKEARLLGDETLADQASGQIAIAAWHGDERKKAEALSEMDALISKLPDNAAIKATLLMNRAEMRLANDLPGAAADFFAVYSNHALTPELKASAGVNYAWTVGLNIADGDWDTALRVCDEVISLADPEEASESKRIHQHALVAHLIAAIVQQREAVKLAQAKANPAAGAADLAAEKQKADLRLKLDRAALASLDAYLASGGDDPKVYEMRASLRLRLDDRRPDLAAAANDFGRAAELLQKRGEQSPKVSDEQRCIEKEDELRMRRLCGWFSARGGLAWQAVGAFDRAINGLGDTTIQTRIGRGFALVLAGEPLRGLEDAGFVAEHSNDAYDLYQAAGIYALAAAHARKAKAKVDRDSWRARCFRSLELLEQALVAQAAAEAQGAPHPKAARIRAFGDSDTFRELADFRRYLELRLTYARPFVGDRNQSTLRAPLIGSMGGGK